MSDVIFLNLSFSQIGFQKYCCLQIFIFVWPKPNFVWNGEFHQQIVSTTCCWVESNMFEIVVSPKVTLNSISSELNQIILCYIDCSFVGGNLIICFMVMGCFMGCAGLFCSFIYFLLYGMDLYFICSRSRICYNIFLIIEIIFDIQFRIIYLYNQRVLISLRMSYKDDMFLIRIGIWLLLYLVFIKYSIFNCVHCPIHHL